MKRLSLAVLVAAAVVLPMTSRAEVAAGKGNVTLLGHIDFVGRYSAPDGDMRKDADYWPGYETYNLEFAVLGMAGQLGDNVDWVILEAFTFVPNGSVYSAMENYDVLGAGNVQPNVLGASLLDARINWHMSKNLILSAGRFIPPTSMTWNPHLMKVLHTINYPLINGSGLQGFLQSNGAGTYYVPPPMYQAGVMLTGVIGPASIMVGNFNGSDIMGGTEIGGAAIAPGVNDAVDIDKTKGTVIKLAADSSGLHCGAWYYGETAAVSVPTPGGDGKFTLDAAITQWGAELGYESDTLIFQAQYMSTDLDPKDSGIDNLKQNGWYALLGVNISQIQIVGRYDYFMYDQDKFLGPGTDNQDEETAITAGVNYMINEGTTLGVDYTWRDVENWDRNLNELAVIIEANLF